VGRQLGAWCALHMVLLLLHSLTLQPQPIVGSLCHPLASGCMVCDHSLLNFFAVPVCPCHHACTWNGPPTMLDWSTTFWSSLWKAATPKGQ
jgi:hypothetical protein